MAYVCPHMCQWASTIKREKRKQKTNKKNLRKLGRERKIRVPNPPNRCPSLVFPNPHWASPFPLFPFSPFFTPHSLVTTTKLPKLNVQGQNWNFENLLSQKWNLAKYEWPIYSRSLHVCPKGGRIQPYGCLKLKRYITHVRPTRFQTQGKTND